MARTKVLLSKQIFLFAIIVVGNLLCAIPLILCAFLRDVIEKSVLLSNEMDSWGILMALLCSVVASVPMFLELVFDFIIMADWKGKQQWMIRFILIMSMSIPCLIMFVYFQIHDAPTLTKTVMWSIFTSIRFILAVGTILYYFSSCVKNKRFTLQHCCNILILFIIARFFAVMQLIYPYMYEFTIVYLSVYSFGTLYLMVCSWLWFREQQRNKSTDIVLFNRDNNGCVPSSKFYLIGLLFEVLSFLLISYFNPHINDDSTRYENDNIRHNRLLSEISNHNAIASRIYAHIIFTVLVTTVPSIFNRLENISTIAENTNKKAFIKVSYDVKTQLKQIQNHVRKLEKNLQTLSPTAGAATHQLNNNNSLDTVSTLNNSLYSVSPRQTSNHSKLNPFSDVITGGDTIVPHTLLTHNATQNEAKRRRNITDIRECSKKALALLEAVLENDKKENTENPLYLNRNTIRVIPYLVQTLKQILPQYTQNNNTFVYDIGCNNMLDSVSIHYRNLYWNVDEYKMAKVLATMVSNVVLLSIPLSTITLKVELLEVLESPRSLRVGAGTAGNTNESASSGRQSKHTKHQQHHSHSSHLSTIPENAENNSGRHGSDKAHKLRFCVLYRTYKTATSSTTVETESQRKAKAKTHTTKTSSQYNQFADFIHATNTVQYNSRNNASIGGSYAGSTSVVSYTQNNNALNSNNNSNGGGMLTNNNYMIDYSAHTTDELINNLFQSKELVEMHGGTMGHNTNIILTKPVEPHSSAVHPPNNNGHTNVTSLFSTRSAKFSPQQVASHRSMKTTHTALTAMETLSGPLHRTQQQQQQQQQRKQQTEFQLAKSAERKAKLLSSPNNSTSGSRALSSQTNALLRDGEKNEKHEKNSRDAQKNSGDKTREDAEHMKLVDVEDSAVVDDSSQQEGKGANETGQLVLFGRETAVSAAANKYKQLTSKENKNKNKPDEHNNNDPLQTTLNLFSDGEGDDDRRSIQVSDVEEEEEDELLSMLYIDIPYERQNNDDYSHFLTQSIMDSIEDYLAPPIRTTEGDRVNSGRIAGNNSGRIANKGARGKGSKDKSDQQLQEMLFPISTARSKSGSTSGTPKGQHRKLSASSTSSPPQHSSVQQNVSVTPVKSIIPPSEISPPHRGSQSQGGDAEPSPLAFSSAAAADLQDSSYADVNSSTERTKHLYNLAVISGPDNTDPSLNKQTDETYNRQQQSQSNASITSNHSDSSTHTHSLYGPQQIPPLQQSHSKLSSQTQAQISPRPLSGFGIAASALDTNKSDANTTTAGSAVAAVETTGSGRPPLGQSPFPSPRGTARESPPKYCGYQPLTSIQQQQQQQQQQSPGQGSIQLAKKFSSISLSSNNTSQYSIISNLSSSGGSNNHTGKRVLIVDDSNTNRKLLARLLAKEGFICDGVGDGDVAVAVIRNIMLGTVIPDGMCVTYNMNDGRRIRSGSIGGGGGGSSSSSSVQPRRSSQSDASEQPYVQLVNKSDHYACITMDYTMTNMNGPYATQLIRELGYSNPIIGVTGVVLPAEIQSFLDAGADAVLTKPVKLPLFMKTYNDIISGANLINKSTVNNASQPVSVNNSNNSSQSSITATLLAPLQAITATATNLVLKRPSSGNSSTTSGSSGGLVRQTTGNQRHSITGTPVVTTNQTLQNLNTTHNADHRSQISNLEIHDLTSEGQASIKDSSSREVNAQKLSNPQEPSISKMKKDPEHTSFRRVLPSNPVVDGTTTAMNKSDVSTVHKSSDHTGPSSIPSSHVQSNLKQHKQQAKSQRQYALVADSNNHTRKAISELLVSRGFDCIEASNGAQAIEMATTGKIPGNTVEVIEFALIVLDSSLSGKSGAVVAGEIKLNHNETAVVDNTSNNNKNSSHNASSDSNNDNHSHANHAVIIGVTAAGNGQEVTDFIVQGADAVIPRPVDETQLINTYNGVLSRRTMGAF